MFRYRLEWLTTHFIPLTDPGNKDWRLLHFDGHNSHLTDEFIATCTIHRIYLDLLPSHSSHITQPLDVGVFSVLKTEYRALLEEFSTEDFGSALSKQRFLDSYLKARKKAFSRRYILMGWEQTGLWPLNEDMVLNSPFILDTDNEAVPMTPQKSKNYDTFVTTPTGGQELRSRVGNNKERGAHNKREHIGLVRKAAKALDKRDFQIMELERENNALKLKIEDMRPKKRQKVAPTLGQRLVMAAQVNAVRQLAEIVDGNRKGGEGTETIPLGDSIISHE